MNVVHFVHIGRNIHIFLIYNVIYSNLKMITVGKVSSKIDLEIKVMPLLHGALQFVFNVPV